MHVKDQYLDVIVRIPVRVVYDDSVCARKVDAKTSSSRRKQEAELLSARSCDDKPRQRVGVCVRERAKATSEDTCVDTNSPK